MTLRTFHTGGTATAGKEERQIIATKEGFIRYYNLKIYRNSAGKILVSNRRNAGVLLVEPKVNLTRGRSQFKTSHEGIYNLMISSRVGLKRQEVLSGLRKSWIVGLGTNWKV